MPPVPKIPQFEVRRSEENASDLLIVFDPPLKKWHFTEPGLADAFVADVNSRVDNARRELAGKAANEPYQTQENLTWIRAVILTTLAFWFASGKVSVEAPVQLDLSFGGKKDEA